MAEQPLAAPAPAPSLAFVAVAPNALLEQLYGGNEEFLATQFLPPLLAPAFEGGHEDTDGKIVFTRTRVTAMALLATPIPEEHQPILRTTLTLETINEVFAVLSKYRQRSFKSLGHFVKEVPQMIQFIPALKAELESIHVNFEEVPVENGLTGPQSRNVQLSGDASLLSPDNTWFTLNALRDPHTGCIHQNGVIFLLGLPALRRLNIQVNSDDLALVMSVKRFVDGATKGMIFSPDVQSKKQTQLLRLVMNAKLNAVWLDVIDWKTENGYLQNAMAFNVLGESNVELKPYADTLDLRCALIRDDYKDIALILSTLGSVTPLKVVQLADTLDLGKLPNMEAYVAAILDKVHAIPNSKVATLLKDPASFAVRLKAESQGVSNRGKAFAKHKTPAKLVNCYDPAFWGAWSGGPGVGARCGNGLFPLINLPNFILASLS